MQFGKVLATIVLLAGLALTGLLGCGPADTGSAETDRAALVALYHAAGGPEWDSNGNWLSDEPLGTWYGVTTNDAGRVTALSLIRNNLDGSIPPELGKLSNLEVLIFVYNQLSGPIPAELGNLSNLEALGLSSNQLTGAVPPELGNLSNLERLGLGSNQLTGTIPPEFGNLFALEFLWFYGNQLTGSIPPELGNLSNLKDLRLHNNRLTGELPISLMRTDLDGLWYKGNSGLCMPRTEAMQSWRRGIERVVGPICPRR